MMGNFHQDAAANILKLANQIKQLDPPQETSLNVTVTQELDRIQWGKTEPVSRYIYVIKTTKCSLDDLQQAYLNFNADSNVNLSRLNLVPDIHNNNVLYVGSSKSVVTRLNQHLGFGNAKTYALHLNKWTDNLKITIELYQYPSDTPDQVIQAIEDHLWDKLSPLFGRKGSR